MAKEDVEVKFGASIEGIEEGAKEAEGKIAELVSIGPRARKKPFGQSKPVDTRGCLVRLSRFGRKPLNECNLQ
jgi:hypothetical protein